MKTVLVIGGTYFVGRVFTLLVSDTEGWQLHLLNRGTFRFASDDIKEYKADRRDAAQVRAVVPPISFDAVVDFCAYSPGDIRTIIDSLQAEIKQYIYISTASIYEPSPNIRDENSTPLLGKRNDPGGQYAYDKLLLERELVQVCAAKDIPYTILRPAFIYGPYNYAPRESYFFERMLTDRPIPFPVDASASFDFVYVADVARACMSTIGNPKSLNNAYNLSAGEHLNYRTYFDELRRLSEKPIRKIEVSVAQVYEDNIPLPFPLDQNELYSGAKAKEDLGLSYTPFSQGMGAAFRAYQKEYQKKLNKEHS